MAALKAVKIENTSTGVSTDVPSMPMPQAGRLQQSNSVQPRHSVPDQGERAERSCSMDGRRSACIAFIDDIRGIRSQDALEGTFNSLRSVRPKLNSNDIDNDVTLYDCANDEARDALEKALMILEAHSFSEVWRYKDSLDFGFKLARAERVSISGLLPAVIKYVNYSIAFKRRQLKEAKAASTPGTLQHTITKIRKAEAMRADIEFDHTELVSLNLEMHERLESEDARLSEIDTAIKKLQAEAALIMENRPQSMSRIERNVQKADELLRVKQTWDKYVSGLQATVDALKAESASSSTLSIETDAGSLEDMEAKGEELRKVVLNIIKNR